MSAPRKPSMAFRGCRCDGCRTAWAAQRRRRVSVPSHVQHGRYSTYVGRSCRCDECRAAWASWSADRRAVRVALLAAGQIEVDHGKASTYGNYGCRCRPCTDAWAAVARERRNRRAS